MAQHKSLNLKELKQDPSLALPFIIIKMACMSRHFPHILCGKVNYVKTICVNKIHQCKSCLVLLLLQREEQNISVLCKKNSYLHHFSLTYYYPCLKYFYYLCCKFILEGCFDSALISIYLINNFIVCNFDHFFTEL